MKRIVSSLTGKVLVAVSLLVMVSLVSTNVFAAESMAFTERAQRIVRDLFYVQCATVSIVPPANGFVVVTATGVSSFPFETSMLQLTLARRAAVEGPWRFNISPGFPLSQSYSIRMVFPVTGGVRSTFFLNGRNRGGFIGPISVETGSMTAEFYRSANVTQLGAPAFGQAEAADDVETVNGR